MSQFAPVQEVGKILSVEPVGAYVEFTVVAPGVAAGFVPGHFVAVAVGGEESALVLRRAFALAAATPGEGTVQFVVAEQGAGTRWLCRQPTGARLDLVGPLGNPFRPADDPAAGRARGRRLRDRAADPARRTAD